jgi:hypothetical protein
MPTLVNRAKMNTSTVGTGDLTLTSAVEGFQTFSAAGVVNGVSVRYVIEEGNNWEIGTGTYNNDVLTRTVLESSNSDLPILLTGNAAVFVTAVAEDIIKPGDNVSELTNDANYSVDGHTHTKSEITDFSDSDYATAAQGTKADTAVQPEAGKGLYPDADATKLSGIEAGATANSTDAQLRARSSHTGTQAISTVSGLQTELDSKLDANAQAVDSDTVDGLHASAFATAAQGTKADNAIPSSEKGSANGVAELDSSGLVPSSQLPSYVDDVLEYANFAAFPTTGETGKIYIDQAEGDVYRWGGSSYIQINDAVSSAEQATKLATARTITVNGDATGSFTFDGSANKTLTLNVLGYGAHQHAVENIDGLQVELDKKWTDKGDIGVGADLNTFIGPGYYHQPSNANAGSGTNYPTDLAGMLSVQEGGGYIYQTYLCYNNNSFYQRTWYNGTWYDWQRAFRDDYHPNADKLTTARTISLSGDAAGSVSFDGSSNVTIDADVSSITPTILTSADDLNTLADGWYAWAGSVPTNAPCDYGILHQIKDTAQQQQMLWSGYSADIYTRRKNSGTWSGWSGYATTSDLNNGLAGKANSSHTHAITDTDGLSVSGNSFRYDNANGYIEIGPKNTTWSHIYSNRPFYFNQQLHVTGSKVFHDTYHPNADKLTTARTISLGGDVSGSASFDGSANVTITATIADDSHNHVISNIDGLQDALDDKLETSGGTVTGSFRITGTQFYEVSTVDAACQRTDARSADGDEARLHWYGLNSAGGTRNFKHAWYDGTNYVNVTVSAGQIQFGGTASSMTIAGNTVFHEGYHPNADKLTTARTINGTSFDGTGNITTSNWGTTRTITIGDTGKNVNGSASMSWSLAEIGAATAAQGTKADNALPKAGGDITGDVKFGAGAGLAFENNGSQGFVLHPGGAIGYHNANPSTGAIKVRLPVPATVADMVSMWIDVFDYTTHESFSVYAAGYIYNNGSWINTTAMILGTMTNRDVPIRFGNDGTKACIWIGDANDTWMYPQVSVRDVQAGYSSDIDSYKSGWEVSFQHTTFENVSSTQTGNLAAASEALKLSTARTIALSGDVSGSASFDGTGNVTISASVADDSHNHTIANVDGLQGALDGKLGTTAKAADSDKLDGLNSTQLLRSDAGNGSDVRLASADGRGLRFWDSDSYKIYMSNEANVTYGGSISAEGDYNLYYKISGTGRGHVFLNGTTPVAQITGTGKVYSTGEIYANTNQRVFADNYHPNADKLTTARTISLSGDVSGSASFDGSSNVTITATISDDSHNHTIANVDGLQTALDSALPKSGGVMTGYLKTKELQETVVALSGTSPSVNLESGTVFTLSTTGNTTFTFTNPVASGSATAFTLKVTSGGSHTLTWPASVKWGGGTPPDAPASGELDVYVFETSDGGSTWTGYQAGDAMA